jgi:hypothetical protein
MLLIIAWSLVQAQQRTTNFTIKNKDISLSKKRFFVSEFLSGGKVAVHFPLQPYHAAADCFKQVEQNY